MSMTTGIQQMGVYSAAATTNALFDALLAILPDPNLTTGGAVTDIRTSSSGAVQGIPGFLDEASPFMVAQLRVELLAMRTEAGNVAI
jgi:hypothetical protein